MAKIAYLKLGARTVGSHHWPQGGGHVVEVEDTETVVNLLMYPPGQFALADDSTLSENEVDALATELGMSQLQIREYYNQPPAVPAAKRKRVQSLAAVEETVAENDEVMTNGE